MPDIPTDSKHAMMVRLPKRLAVEVRQIAVREAESQSTILRRLITRGLAVEQRSASGATEAA